MRFFWLLPVLALACASRQQRPEKLYFALEVRREGAVVARPKLLGETGVALRAERRSPGASRNDYELRLSPQVLEQPGSYRVKLDLELPFAQGHSELDLLHGEERRIELGKRPGELEVRLLLMRVDSPEFRALMELAEPPKAPRSI